MQFESINSQSIYSFLKKWTASLVLFHAKNEDECAVLMAKLSETVSHPRFVDFGLGIVDTKSVFNKPLILRENIFTFPVARFYYSNGISFGQDWIGFEEIFANSGEAELSDQYLQIIKTVESPFF